MKNWRDVYKGKAVSAAEAVSHIRSGNRVVVGHATGSPEVLLKAMVENREAYKNVELVHMLSMGASEYCLPG
ncbi:MAG TPA: 4-hydroxybutyrate CoA-transferase, partial [Deltaproteobacteria bacterium]|nr:4-hydroxybutyrate CoA-transferase [Deltaproteobacteria bacterium]